MDVARFTIDDLSRDDLAGLGWSGGPLHLEAVAEALDRRDRGEVDYLIVRAADGDTVSKAGVDYTVVPGAGTIWQVATHKDFEGRGLATRLIEECERRIAARHVKVARLGVEYDNERARRLYEHLGYEQVGEEPDGWDYLDEDGVRQHYTTVCAVLEKRLR